jgi:hypothetical protein
MVDSIFEPLHARFDFTSEGCANDEGLNSHGDLPHYSPSDSILHRDLSGERVLTNPLWKLAKQIGRHFERGRRTAPTSTMIVFALSKWAKFNKLTQNWKLYQEFLARTQVFTRHSLNDPTQQKVVYPAPWHVQLWLVDADCAFSDPAPTTVSDKHTSVHVPPHVLEDSIATLRQFSPEGAAMITDLIEARPLIQTELTVKTPNGMQLISGLVDCDS